MLKKIVKVCIDMAEIVNKIEDKKFKTWGIIIRRFLCNKLRYRRYIKKGYRESST